MYALNPSSKSRVNQQNIVRSKIPRNLSLEPLEDRSLPGKILHLPDLADELKAIGLVTRNTAQNKIQVQNPSKSTSTHELKRQPVAHTSPTQDTTLSFPKHSLGDPTSNLILWSANASSAIDFLSAFASAANNEHSNHPQESPSTEALPNAASGNADGLPYFGNATITFAASANIIVAGINTDDGRGLESALHGSIETQSNTTANPEVNTDTIPTNDPSAATTTGLPQANQLPTMPSSSQVLPEAYSNEKFLQMQYEKMRELRGTQPDYIPGLAQTQKEGQPDNSLSPDMPALSMSSSLSQYQHYTLSGYYDAYNGFDDGFNIYFSVSGGYLPTSSIYKVFLYWGMEELPVDPDLNPTGGEFNNYTYWTPTTGANALPSFTKLGSTTYNGQTHHNYRSDITSIFPFTNAVNYYNQFEIAPNDDDNADNYLDHKAVFDGGTIVIIFQDSKLPLNDIYIMNGMTGIAENSSSDHTFTSLPLSDCVSVKTTFVTGARSNLNYNVTYSVGSGYGTNSEQTTAHHWSTFTDTSAKRLVSHSDTSLEVGVATGSEECYWTAQILFVGVELPPDKEPKDKCGCDVPPDLLRDPFGKSASPPNTSAGGVVAGDGSIVVGSTDLSSNAFGVNWGQYNAWSNEKGFKCEPLNGNGRDQSQFPSMERFNDGNTLSLISNNSKSRYFDLSGSNYVERHHGTDTLTVDPETGRYVVYDAFGNKLVLESHGTSIDEARRGQMVYFEDPYGNRTTVIRWTEDGLPAEVVRSTPYTVASNLLSNSDFETPSVTSGHFVGSVTNSTSGYSTGNFGWTIASGNIDHIYTYWDAHTGNNSIELNGDTPATIEQTVTTIPGKRYQLSFYYSDNKDLGSTDIAHANVLVLDGATSINLWNISHSSSTSVYQMNYSLFSETFVATSTATTILFQGLNSTASYAGDSRGMVIDSVALQQVSSTVVESFVYEYTTLSDDRQMLTDIVQRRQIDNGDWETIRQVQYDYYDSTSDSYGNVGDLKTTTTLDADDNVLSQRYFRYYKQGDENGYRGGMKLTLSPESFARATNDLGNPFTASDSSLLPYADSYMEYNLTGRVTVQRIQGEGCSSCSGGLGEYQYTYTTSEFGVDYNSWHTKTEVELPDGNREIIFTNFYGQVMLHNMVEVIGEENVRIWSDYYQYDEEGRLLLHATPAAVAGYYEFFPQLIFEVEGENPYLRDNEGVITRYQYASSTSATTSTVGTAEGLLASVTIQRGELGDEVPQVDYGYILNANGLSFLAKEEHFTDDAGANELATTYSYNWFSGNNQIQQLTVNLPAISTSHNGSGASDSISTVFDRYGFPIWTKDADGFIQYSAFDISTGSMIKHIEDVDTTITNDFVSLPSGWSTPSGGGLHLVSSFEVDLLGRPTKMTDPSGKVTYSVYDDVEKEVRTYIGWDASTSRPTLPTIVTRNDWGRRYTETLTMSATPSVDNGRPTGQESISGVQSLSRQHLSIAAQVTSTTDYFNLTGLTYSNSSSLGSVTTTGADGNYLLTSYSYDQRGRLSKTVSPSGTIYRTIFDLLGRPISNWVGVDDSPSSGYWSADNPANMVMTSELFYDQDQEYQIGDGNLTSMIEYPGGGETNRLTQMAYDWRERLVAMKSGVLESEDSTTHRLISYFQYDNLDRPTNGESYAGDTVGLFDYNSEFDKLDIIDTNDDGVPDRPSSSLLRAKSTTSYDGRDRAFRVQTYSVDPSSGIVGNSVSTNTWFNKRSQVIKTSVPGGLVQKNSYDGAGRVITSYVTDGGSDSSWSDAKTVTGDIVLSQTETNYDLSNNPVFTVTKDRFHDASGTGALGTASTGVLARVSYAAAYYDLANRTTATVTVGTNGGSSYTLPTSVPTASDTVLVSTMSYDAAGRLKDVIDPIGVKTRTTYDALGRVAKTIRHYTDGTPTSSSNYITEFTYHPSGNIRTLTARLPSSAEQTTQYFYGVTHQPSGGTGSAISSNDLLYQVKYPSGSTGLPATPAEQYFYNALGQSTRFTDRNGSTHAYSYDLLGRMVSDAVTTLASGVDGQVRRLQTSYDDAGRGTLFTSYDAASSGSITSQVSQTFNGLGQVVAEYQQHGAAVNTSTSPVVQYGYSTLTSTNNLSRLTGMTYPNGRTLAYSYASGLDSNISRVSSIADASNTLETYSYLGLSTIVKRTRSENRTEMTYAKLSGESNSDAGDQYTGLDRFGRVVDQRWTYTNTDSPAIISNTDRFFYAYGRDGRVLYRENAVNSSFSELYGYDTGGQLTSFSLGLLNSTKDAIQGTASRSQSWSMDATGNWASLTTDSTTVNRTHDLQNRTTAVGSSSLAYDNNGNMLTDEIGNTYKYDAWNRLIQVKDSSNAVLAAYSYDALGRRTQEVHGSETRDLYYATGWQLIEEQVSGVTKSQNVWGLGYIDSLVLRDRDADSNTSNGLEERRYAQQDAIWNVTSLMNSTGSSTAPVEQRYIYDPYGKASVLTSSWGSGSIATHGFLNLFKGGRLDSATGLIHFRNRDLSGTLGRWLLQDPINYNSGTNNIYQFCSNVPTNRSDAYGLDDIRDFKSWHDQIGKYESQLNETCKNIKKLGKGDLLIFSKDYLDENRNKEKTNELNWYDAQRALLNSKGVDVIWGVGSLKELENIRPYKLWGDRIKGPFMSPPAGADTTPLGDIYAPVTYDRIFFIGHQGGPDEPPGWTINSKTQERLDYKSLTANPYLADKLGKLLNPGGYFHLGSCQYQGVLGLKNWELKMDEFAVKLKANVAAWNVKGQYNVEYGTLPRESWDEKGFGYLFPVRPELKVFPRK